MTHYRQNLRVELQRVSFIAQISGTGYAIEIGSEEGWQGVDCAARDVAQLGSAPALGAGGRWFKSSRPDQEFHTQCGGRA